MIVGFVALKITNAYFYKLPDFPGRRQVKICIL
jgi:hypothetical protein